ncbi:MAG: prepilin-type N-terminal cleavage/methylation domain-containing protein [Verrucomicrobiota bacterium]
MRKSKTGTQSAFTLVEVLIALALSAAIFAAAINLLLGIVAAWEKAREGDLEADSEFRLFSFLQGYLQSFGEDDLSVETLPGELADYWITFTIENSPLTRDVQQEWKTERFALVVERDEIRLVPVVGENEDRPRTEDGVLLYGEGVEVEYWVWDEARERWEAEEELESRGGVEPSLPEYLVLTYPDETVRWIRLGSPEGDLALW